MRTGETARTLAAHDTPDGRLELRQRGERDFLITIAGRVLMSSSSRSSEEALATLGLADLRAASPRVLISGLGMGFTLRAALDALPASAVVTVVEIDPRVVEWCRGPLADATGNAVGDPRVRVEVADVARVIRNAAPASFDTLLLDLYEGPHAATQRRDDPFYGPDALVQQRRALAKGGVLAVWGEDPEPAYGKRMGTAGFAVTTHSIGKGGRKHTVFVGAAR